MIVVLIRMRGNILICFGWKHKLVDSSLRTIRQYLLKFKSVGRCPMT